MRQLNKHQKSKQISHKIDKIEEKENSEVFKVSIRINFSLGFIENVKFAISIHDHKDVYELYYVKNEEDCGEFYAIFETNVEIAKVAICYYYFSFYANSVFQYYKKLNITGNNSIIKEEYWKLSVGFDVPDWAKGANMYHIFVDRFYRSSKNKLLPMPRRTIHENWNDLPILGPDENGIWNADFYGGDLIGIKEKIPYLKSLSIDIIYLSPICLSQSNHRYDTADYENVDPYVGTNEDLKDLCDELHKNGMKLILDAVFNHTGDDSKYFNKLGTYPTVGAYQSQDSPFFDFYVRRWFQGEQDFSYWWGLENLPECDSNSNHWREYIFGENGVIDKWFALGIDGLRLDVADCLSDEFIEGIVSAVKRNKKDGLVIGEVWKNPMRMNRSYISSGKGMHSVMNYLLVDALIRYYKYTDISKLDNTIQEIMNEYPEGTIQTMMNFTSTHDISRLIEFFSTNSFQEYGEWSWDLLNSDLGWISSHKLTPCEYDYGKITLKSYITVLAFFPGIFSIFYGDEVGHEGIGNLANRGPFPWHSADFDLLQFFQKICFIRKKETFLKTADLKILELNANYISYERYDGENSIIVIASRTHHVVNLDQQFDSYEIIFNLPNCSKSELSPYGALVLKN